MPQLVVAEEIPDACLEAVVRIARGDLEQVFVHRTYVVVDGLVVVVEQNKNVGTAGTGIVEPFVGEPSGHGPVTYEGDGLALESLQSCRLCESERSRDGCR